MEGPEAPHPLPRVLWITAEPPDLGHSGGSIRQARLILALADRARVHLLVAGRLRDPVVRAAVAGLTEVDVTGSGRPWSRTRWRLERLRGALLESDPYEVVASRTQRVALGNALMALGDHDVYVVEHTWLAGLVDRGRAGAWMVTLQQLASRQAEQELAASTSRRRRWLARLELHRARRHEAWIATNYDRVFVTSTEDGSAFAGESSVVPNGAETAAYPDGWRRPPVAPTLLFVGHLAYRPNVEGLRWFCDQVLPLVRARRPGTRLQVVGRAPVPEVLAMSQLEGVSVAADVPSTRPYLESASLEVVPLTVGSGTRLKALEALAAGVPLVGTAVGLEGLGLVDGETACIADTPHAMASAIVRVLDDGTLAEALSAAGRQLVRQHFDWQAIGAAFAGRVLAPVTGGAPAATARP